MDAIGIGKTIAAILLIIGAGFNLIGSLGIVRLPDIYMRSHASTKSATIGVLCVLAGTFLYFWFENGVLYIRIILGIIFVFLTAPVAGHLIGRAAYRAGVPMSGDIQYDDLKDKIL